MGVLVTSLVLGRQMMDQRASALSPAKMHCNASMPYACTATFALKSKGNERFADLIDPCEKVSLPLVKSIDQRCRKQSLVLLCMIFILAEHLKKTLLRDRDTWQAVGKSKSRTFVCLICEMSLVASAGEEYAVKPSALY